MEKSKKVVVPEGQPLGIDLEMLEKSISQVMDGVGKVAEMADRVAPLLTRLMEFAEWAKRRPGEQQGKSAVAAMTEWTPPGNYVELAGMAGKCVEALPEFKGGVESIHAVKVVVDSTGAQVPEVAEVKVGHRIMYWKPEPLGAMVGRIWADGETAEILKTWVDRSGEESA